MSNMGRRRWLDLTLGLVDLGPGALVSDRVRVQAPPRPTDPDDSSPASQRDGALRAIWGYTPLPVAGSELARFKWRSGSKLALDENRGLGYKD
jgi:hypothetical protein